MRDATAMMSMTHLSLVVLWGLLATVLMTTIMVGAQGFGVSRLSLPFLVGSAVSDRLRGGYVAGYVLYAAGGWAFAFLYDVLFRSLGHQSWWLGGLVGLAHGAFLLTMLMHLPLIHPRMASEYDRPRMDRAIEPPGFLGLHYGRQTPLVALLAHGAYGALLGATLPT